MKLPKIRRQKGAIILVVIVIVALLLFLGYTIWQIYKILRSLPSRTTPPDEQTSEVQQASGEMLAEFQTQNTNEISQIQTQVFTMTTVAPFDPVNILMTIWRSTNLVDWECVGTNQPGETWTDLNPPWPNGFYKRVIQ